MLKLSVPAKRAKRCTGTSLQQNGGGSVCWADSSSKHTTSACLTAEREREREREREIPTLVAGQKQQTQGGGPQ